MANVLISAITSPIEIVEGTASLLVIDVSPYREIRGFFGSRPVPETILTLTLQILKANDPADKPNAADGTVIGVLDQFIVDTEFSRSYSAPGLWLQVLASASSGGFPVRINRMAFVGWE
ncbi:MAG: hypothetical protein WBA31_09400 [Candidatus Dormiibacterota bacterium]